MGTLGALCCLAVLAADPAIRPDLPNAVSFPAQEARFVRFVIDRSNGGDPCIDELEVYGPDGKQNLALAGRGAKVSASSCIAGFAKHAIEHLNDGRYGNDFSWIAGGTGQQWAQIEIPQSAAVAKVVFSRDRKREYADRVPVQFEVRLSLDGRQWKTVKQVSARAASVAVRPRAGDFAGVVPNPPPPPRMTAAGVAAAPAEDLKAPVKDEIGMANLARGLKAKAAASSVLPGHAIHQIAHLNDGRAGNDHSWISNGEPSWAEIDLGDVYWVCHVAFGSDNSQKYGDRAATRFSILAGTEYSADSASKTWTPVYKHSGPPIHVRTSFRFKPVQARWVRVAIEGGNQDPVRIDELEIYGQREPIPADRVASLLKVVPAQAAETDELLRYAFLGEEHAWLKAYGRADLSPRLVPYNGRVKEYPKHVGDDRLPLPPLSAEPKLNGSLDDPCWAEASRGVVRVADPYDFQRGPLVATAVTAGWKGDALFLAIRTDRLLSGHVAVISRADGEGCGVLAVSEKGLVFNTYEVDGKLKQSRPVEGAMDRNLTTFEARLPLAWFEDCRAQGLRIGLGMGGRHTAAAGRPVLFVFSSLAIAEVGPCRNGKFQVRLAVPPGAKPARLRGEAPELSAGLDLPPGQAKVVTFAAENGPIGPQRQLAIEDDESGETYAIHLFRYDPLGRTLALMDEMLNRLAAKGLDTAKERAEAAALHRRHQLLLSAERPDWAAERQVLFDARLAKRRLVFRDSDLGVLEKILFVKRHAYEPSHNYSVMLDSAWRPGGGIYRLEIPRSEGRLDPDRAALVQLFDSGSGIARDPMATFGLDAIYFAYRPSPEGYFHVMRMGPDGSGVKQLTQGPFHDYWPCPLPDGGLAFISSRCRARYLCWRPQAAVMFRMAADGSQMRPLSYANLSEWGPSVTRDGRLIWTRSEYIDKGADFSHTLWTIRPDGTMPELVFGNDIIQPNGYANGREVPGTGEVCCTLISHFGDLNGPIALIDVRQGRFNPKAIRSITPEVPWPGMWPEEECFRDPVPVARDYVLVSHAPRRQFGLYVIDRYGNREVLHQDLAIGSMCPTPWLAAPTPPVLYGQPNPEDQEQGTLAVADVYRGIQSVVPRGSIKYLRVVEEVRSNLEQLPNGEYRKDHEPFMRFYASPVDLVSGPFGWPSYVAKAPWGLAPVEEDGSAHFYAPAGKTLYLQALDKDLNEVQRMRSVVQLQPGEQRSCIGCHEDRRHAPPPATGIALRRPPSPLEPPPWGAGSFSYERAVQPIWDAKCVKCHAAGDKQGIDLRAALDADRVPASYRTLIRQGWVHVLDCGYNSGGNEKRAPYTFGTFQSKLWKVLDKDHYDARLTRDEVHAIKCWTDLNCPLWPNYGDRLNRPMDTAAK